MKLPIIFYRDKIEIEPSPCGIDQFEWGRVKAKMFGIRVSPRLCLVLIGEFRMAIRGFK